MDVSRRKFFKICAGGMAGTTAAALGFAPKMALAQARNFKLLRAKEIRNTCTYCSVGCGLLMYSLGDGAKNAKEAIYHIEGMAGTTAAALGFAPKMALAQARNFKLLRAKEIRNTCTYCSVGCGLLMYSLGDGAKNAKEAIYHIEGDPDHPVSRGALCPKGAGLLDYVHSENRLRYPQYRAPGSDKWQRISWDEAFNRIARLMKADRDANFIEKNEQGVTVNRWLSTGMLCASAASNETGMLTQKFVRSLGMLAVDNQARV